MKKAILIFFIIPFITLTGFSQTITQDSLTGKYQSQGIKKIDSLLSKGEIYSRTNEWIALNFKSSNDVIQLADKETGKIIGKGSFKTNMFMKEGWIEYTFLLEFKDGKIRYTYTDFFYSSVGSGRMAFEGSMISKKKVIQTTEENIKSSLSNLKTYIKQSVGNKDW